MSKKAKILWTTDNKETSLHMVCLYAHNAILKGWMDEVEVLVWGCFTTFDRGRCGSANQS